MRFRTLSNSIIYSLSLLLSATAAANQPENPFGRTVVALQTATAEVRAQFASLALGQLANAYIMEAGLAITDQVGRQGKQRRWSRSVERYANELLILKMDIDNGMDVRIQMTPSTGAIVQVAEHRVVLSYPRPNQQTAYEQALLETFCQQQDCNALALAEPQTAPLFSNEFVEPSWSFNEDGARCGGNGLTLQFRLTDRLAAQRGFCTALFQEVEELVAELSRQQDYGVMIDWQNLAILKLRQDMGYEVSLNDEGDSFVLQLPVLAAMPKLLPLLRPWLARRVNSRSAQANDEGNAQGNANGNNQSSGTLQTLSLQADQLNWHQVLAN